MPAVNPRHFQMLFWLFFLFISYKFLAPAEHSGINIPYLDKIAHLGIFFMLSALAHGAYKLSNLQHYLLFGLYGALIEVLQGISGLRSAELMDWIADMLGIFLFLLLLTCYQRFNKQDVTSYD